MAANVLFHSENVKNKEKVFNQLANRSELDAIDIGFDTHMSQAVMMHTGRVVKSASQTRSSHRLNATHREIVAGEAVTWMQRNELVANYNWLVAISPSDKILLFILTSRMRTTIFVGDYQGDLERNLHKITDNNLLTQLKNYIARVKQTHVDEDFGNIAVKYGNFADACCSKFTRRTVLITTNDEYFNKGVGLRSEFAPNYAALMAGHFGLHGRDETTVAGYCQNLFMANNPASIIVTVYSHNRKAVMMALRTQLSGNKMSFYDEKAGVMLTTERIEAYTQFGGAQRRVTYVTERPVDDPDSPAGKSYTHEADEYAELGYTVSRPTLHNGRMISCVREVVATSGSMHFAIVTQNVDGALRCRMSPIVCISDPRTFDKPVDVQQRCVLFCEEKEWREACEIAVNTLNTKPYCEAIKTAYASFRTRKAAMKTLRLAVEEVEAGKTYNLLIVALAAMKAEMAEPLMQTRGISLSRSMKRIFDARIRSRLPFVQSEEEYFAEIQGRGCDLAVLGYGPKREKSWFVDGEKATTTEGIVLPEVFVFPSYGKQKRLTRGADRLNLLRSSCEVKESSLFVPFGAAQSCTLVGTACVLFVSQKGSMQAPLVRLTPVLTTPRRGEDAGLCLAQAVLLAYNINVEEHASDLASLLAVIESETEKRKMTVVVAMPDEYLVYAFGSRERHIGYLFEVADRHVQTYTFTCKVEKMLCTTNTPSQASTASVLCEENGEAIIVHECFGASKLCSEDEDFADADILVKGQRVKELLALHDAAPKSPEGLKAKQLYDEIYRRAARGAFAGVKYLLMRDFAMVPQDRKIAGSVILEEEVFEIKVLGVPLVQAERARRQRETLLKAGAVTVKEPTREAILSALAMQRVSAVSASETTSVSEADEVATIAESACSSSVDAVRVPDNRVGKMFEAIASAAISSFDQVDGNVNEEAPAPDYEVLGEQPAGENYQRECREAYQVMVERISDCAEIFRHEIQASGYIIQLDGKICDADGTIFEQSVLEQKFEDFKSKVIALRLAPKLPKAVDPKKVEVFQIEGVPASGKSRSVMPKLIESGLRALIITHSDKNKESWIADRTKHTSIRKGQKVQLAKQIMVATQHSALIHSAAEHFDVVIVDEAYKIAEFGFFAASLQRHACPIIMIGHADQIGRIDYDRTGIDTRRWYEPSAVLRCYASFTIGEETCEELRKAGYEIYGRFFANKLQIQVRYDPLLQPEKPERPLVFMNRIPYERCNSKLKYTADTAQGKRFPDYEFLLGHQSLNVIRDNEEIIERFGARCYQDRPHLFVGITRHESIDTMCTVTFANEEIAKELFGHKFLQRFEKLEGIEIDYIERKFKESTQLIKTYQKQKKRLTVVYEQYLDSQNLNVWQEYARVRDSDKCQASLRRRLVIMVGETTTSDLTFAKKKCPVDGVFVMFAGGLLVPVEDVKIGQYTVQNMPNVHGCEASKLVVADAAVRPECGTLAARSRLRKALFSQDVLKGPDRQKYSKFRELEGLSIDEEAVIKVEAHLQSEGVAFGLTFDKKRSTGLRQEPEFEEFLPVGLSALPTSGEANLRVDFGNELPPTEINASTVEIAKQIISENYVTDDFDNKIIGVEKEVPRFEAKVDIEAAHEAPKNSKAISMTNTSVAPQHSASNRLDTLYTNATRYSAKNRGFIDALADKLSQEQSHDFTLLCIKIVMAQVRTKTTPVKMQMIDLIESTVANSIRHHALQAIKEGRVEPIVIRVAGLAHARKYAEETPGVELAGEAKSGTEYVLEVDGDTAETYEEFVEKVTDQMIGWDEASGELAAAVAKRPHLSAELLQFPLNCLRNVLKTQMKMPTETGRQKGVDFVTRAKAGQPVSAAISEHAVVIEQVVRFGMEVVNYLLHDWIVMGAQRGEGPYDTARRFQRRLKTMKFVCTDVSGMDASHFEAFIMFFIALVIWACELLLKEHPRLMEVIELLQRVMVDTAAEWTTSCVAFRGIFRAWYQLASGLLWTLFLNTLAVLFVLNMMLVKIHCWGDQILDLEMHELFPENGEYEQERGCVIRTDDYLITRYDIGVVAAQGDDVACEPSPGAEFGNDVFEAFYGAEVKVEVTEGYCIFCNLIITRTMVAPVIIRYVAKILTRSYGKSDFEEKLEEYRESIRDLVNDFRTCERRGALIALNMMANEDLTYHECEFLIDFALGFANSSMKRLKSLHSEVTLEFLSERNSYETTNRTSTEAGGFKKKFF